MELLQKRKIKSPNSTIGEFSIDGVFKFYGLEPIDRGLTSDMTLAQIASIKVATKTAIPTGRYQVVKYFSPKHNAEVPMLKDVPGFGYVEIHVGNTAKDTDACLLLGISKGVDCIGSSKVAIEDFYKEFFDALDCNEEVWITYVREY